MKELSVTSKGKAVHVVAVGDVLSKSDIIVYSDFYLKQHTLCVLSYFVIEKRYAKTYGSALL